MIGTRCKHPGCIALVQGRFCEEHKADEPKRWGKEQLEFYKTSRWQALRIKVLRRASCICELCNEGRATIAHHIKPALFFPELRFKIDNLQAVCRDCHDEHSAKERTIYNRLGSSPERIRAYFESIHK